MNNLAEKRLAVVGVGVTCAVNFGLWQQSFSAGCFVLTFACFISVLCD